MIIFLTIITHILNFTVTLVLGTYGEAWQEEHFLHNCRMFLLTRYLPSTPCKLYANFVTHPKVFFEQTVYEPHQVQGTVGNTI